MDFSDRPILCSAANWQEQEVVVGSADHALYVLDTNKLKQKRQLYNKTNGHKELAASHTARDSVSARCTHRCVLHYSTDHGMHTRDLVDLLLPGRSIYQVYQIYVDWCLASNVNLAAPFTMQCKCVQMGDVCDVPSQWLHTVRRHGQ